MNPEEKSLAQRGIEDLLDDVPPERRRALARTWELLDGARFDTPQVPTTEEAWAELEPRLRRLPDRGPARRRRPMRLVPISLAAGAFAAAVLIAAFWWMQPVSITVPAGEIVSVDLPDGSIAHLNSGTHLEYRRALGDFPLLGSDHREVRLSGEAYFHVATGERPFIVETSNAEIQVLGTRFNVRAWGSRFDGDTEVVLDEGRVRVTAGDHEEVILSESGQIARVAQGPPQDTTIAVDRADLEFVLAWRERSFAAVDRPIASILLELERRYALTIAVEGNLPLDESMTVLYGPEIGPADILHDICLRQGCRFRATNDGFALYDEEP